MRPLIALFLAISACDLTTPDASSIAGELVTCRGDRCDPSFSKDPITEERTFHFVATAKPNILGNVDPETRLQVTVGAGLKDAADGVTLLAFLDGPTRSGPEGAAVLKRGSCREAELTLSFDHLFADCEDGVTCTREVSARFHVLGDGLVVGHFNANLLSNESGAALHLELR